MPAKPKFTRIPKTSSLVEAGVPVEAIPTYCALADHASNRTGECWPSMNRLAEILGKSVRTIQRHLHTLKACGLIQFVERRRHRGRFSSYLYKVLHVATIGHGRPVGRRSPIYKGTRRIMNTPKSPKEEAFNWFFGKPRDLEAEAEHQKLKEEERKRVSERRREGYEWLFKV